MIGMSYFSSQTNITRKKQNSNIEMSETSIKLPPKKLQADYNRKHISPRSVSKLNLTYGDESELHIVQLQTENLERDIEVNEYDEKDTFKGKAISVVESKIGSVAMVKRLSTHLNNQYNIKISTRTLGFIIAVIGGIWGGSVMVPIHYADSNSKGFNFVFSFAIGTSFVNTFAWIIRFYFTWIRSSKNLQSTLRALPSFHFRSMVMPGACSGTLYCIGNLASIVSVTILGEGVGYSMTQSSMLVSGMWGIFWYREITDPLCIRGWLIMATITLSGMMILCLSHVSKTAPAILDL